MNEITKEWASLSHLMLYLSQTYFKLTGKSSVDDCTSIVKLGHPSKNRGPISFTQYLFSLINIV